MSLFSGEGTDWHYTSGSYHTAEFTNISSFSGGGGGASDCLCIYLLLNNEVPLELPSLSKLTCKLH